MRFINAVFMLIIGLLLLPVGLILLLMDGGAVEVAVAVIFFVLAIVFLTLSTRRIITKHLIKQWWFWLISLFAIAVLIGIYSLY